MAGFQMSTEVLVDVEGVPQNVAVVRALGLGLDETLGSRRNVDGRAYILLLHS